jgi:inward rectifier potassium channel
MRTHEPEQHHNRHQNKDEDFGFSSKINKINKRFLNHDGTFNILKKSMKGAESFSLYLWLLSISWAQFLGVIILFYIIKNLIFGYLFYLLGPDAVLGLESHHLHNRLLSCFFFSLQTSTTVGYGQMYPNGIAANVLSGACAFAGIITVALITGLIFARFSKPTHGVKFSTMALVNLDNNDPTIKFRLINIRKDVLSNLHIIVIATWIDETSSSRQFKTLALERDHIVLLPLNWTIVHHLDQHSPLHNWTQKDFFDKNIEIMIRLSAHNDNLGDMVHTSFSYTAQELEWNKNFKSIFNSDKNGNFYIDHNLLNAIE